MRVLVTGAGGFVGRVLVRHLENRHEVLAFDRSLSGMQGIEGDLRDPVVLDRVLTTPCDAIVHLATVPGGAAENDPTLAWQINVDGTQALFEQAARRFATPRLVFASSIAVFGDRLPAQIDENTPISPRLIYGAHKAMMETWLDTLTRRGMVCGVSLRLPGIVARPHPTPGMKSAFLSDLFHAVRNGAGIELPVSERATTLLMSVNRAAANLAHAVEQRFTGRLTLPALHVKLPELVAAIAAHTGAPPTGVRWNPDPVIEAQFGRFPPVSAPGALDLGLDRDRTLAELVRSAFDTV